MAESQNINLYNREISNSIKTMFTPHFNLFQKTLLQEKISCFDKFYKTPSSYYECIEKIDDKMSQSSSYLSKKFLALEHFKSECEEKCRVSLASYNEAMFECMKKCGDSMKTEAITTYKAFYESHLSPSPEYKNIKI